MNPIFIYQADLSADTRVAVVDVDDNGESCRRLLRFFHRREGMDEYLSELVQSEARVCIDEAGKFMLQAKELVQPYHRMLIVSLLFRLSTFPLEPKILILGHGAGLLGRFITSIHRAARIQAVERSPEVVEASHVCFGSEERTEICVCDAVGYVERCGRGEGGGLDAIIIDIDNGGGIDSDLCAPSEELLTMKFLRRLKSLLGEGGTASVNVLAARGREQRVKEAAIARFRRVFGRNSVFWMESEDQTNIILVGVNGSDLKPHFLRCLSTLHSRASTHFPHHAPILHNLLLSTHFSFAT